MSNPISELLTKLLAPQGQLQDVDFHVTLGTRPDSLKETCSQILSGLEQVESGRVRAVSPNDVDGETHGTAIADFLKRNNIDPHDKREDLPISTISREEINRKFRKLRFKA